MKLKSLLSDDLIKKHDLFRLFIRFVTPVSAKWFVDLGNWLIKNSLAQQLLPNVLHQFLVVGMKNLTLQVNIAGHGQLQSWTFDVTSIRT